MNTFDWHELNGLVEINNFFKITSPLEQFTVTRLVSIPFIGLDLTNSAVYCLLTAGLIASLWSIIFYKGGLIVPSKYQVTTEGIYLFISNLIQEQLGPINARKYICVVFTVFIYILSANLLGLIPFSFASTAQLVVAFSLSFSLFCGVTIIGLLKHKLHFLSFFLPSGAPIALAPLLVIIELISYIFRPISLGVRLLANMTAGHSLLAIIAGFSWTMMGVNTLFMTVLATLPATVIIAIYGLELAVAFLQAYVFAVLLCIYLKDAIELH